MTRARMFLQFYTFVGIIREMKLKQKFILFCQVSHEYSALNIFEYYVHSIGL